MKQVTAIIGLFVVTFLLALGGNMALLWMHRDTAAAPAALAAASTAAARDSAALSDSSASGRDTLRHIAAVDTVRLMADTLSQIRAQLASDLARMSALEKAMARKGEQVDSAKAKQRGDFAKMIDAMGADEAAKILQNLPDTETRQVLLAVKKRQAGKILGAMEPRHAARLMD